MKQRKILSAVLALVMVLTLLPVTALAELTGSGTTDAPYEVDTAAELTEALASGGNIRVTENISVTSTNTLEIIDTKTVILDLNGKTVTWNTSAVCAIDVKSGGSLTIQDSSEQGNGALNITSIYNKTTNSGIRVNAGGSLNLTGGTVSYYHASKSGYGAIYLGSGSGHQFTMSGGTVRLSGYVNYGIRLYGGTGTITGGAVEFGNLLTSTTHGVYVYNATCAIENLVVDASGVADGMKVNCVYGTGGSSHLTIASGTYTANDNDNSYAFGSGSTNKNTSITGGTFNGQIGNYGVSITDGRFSEPGPAGSLPDGKIFGQQEDDYYHVVDGTYVATTSDGAGFTSWEDLWRALPDGTNTVVYILANATEIVIPEGKNVTFYNNKGKTVEKITNNGTCRVYLYAMAGTQVVNNGTFTLDNEVGSVVNNAGADLTATSSANSKVTGTITNSGSMNIAKGNYLGEITNTGTISLTGGTFATDVKAFCAAGYTTRKNDSNTWDVVKITFASGTGTQDDPYVIANLDQFKTFRDSVNNGESYQGKYVELADNIDLNNEEWNPIGGTNTDEKFAGTFDGNGKTISNLKITKGLTNTYANCSVGLFGACTGEAKLQNFTLNNVDVKGSLNVAPVLGGSGGAEADITNVHVTGSVKVYGYWYVGGILGKGYSTVTNCSVEGDGVNTSSIAITGGYVGGIVGFMGEGACITGSCEVSNITISGPYNGIGGVNGILHYGNTIRNCTVNNVVVWETGDPEADGRRYVGAFAGTYLDNSGENCPTLENCTFTGKLYSGSDKTDVTEETRYVGSLWYGAQPPATVNIKDCTVTSKTPLIPVQSVTMQETLTLTEGEAEQLTATVTPTDASQQTISWETSDPKVATVENGKVTAVAAGQATITVKVNDAESEYGFASDTCVVTVKEKETTGGSSTGGSGSSGSSGNKTETVTNPDGSTTTTVTRPDGSTTETTKNPDGSKEVVETKKDGTVTTTTTDTNGNKTETVEKTDGSSETTVTNKDGSSSTTTVSKEGQVETEVTLPADALDAAEESGAAAALAMPPVPVVTNRDNAPVVTVSLPAGRSAKVEIPVEDVTPGTVAVQMMSDGTAEVIQTTVTTENGIAVTLSDGDTVKIVDNTKDFVDVSDSYWGSDEIDFAASRELMSGTSATTFSPEGDMTRAMVVTVLARYEGEDTTGGDTWYDQAVTWAVENGVSDGTNLMDSITREQLATMLYRYAGEPEVTGTITGFSDADKVSGWAKDAMIWATQTGLIGGVGGGVLNPQGTATRAQVAAILARFVAAMN